MKNEKQVTGVKTDTPTLSDFGMSLKKIGSDQPIELGANDLVKVTITNKGETAGQIILTAGVLAKAVTDQNYGVPISKEKPFSPEFLEWLHRILHY